MKRRRDDCPHCRRWIDHAHIEVEPRHGRIEDILMGGATMALVLIAFILLLAMSPGQVP